MMNLINKSFGILVALAFTVLSVPTHARDWGFSKDTLGEPNSKYGSSSGAPDEVVLENTGSLPLEIDSVWAEVIEPKTPEKYFYVISQAGAGLLFRSPFPYWGKHPFFDDNGNFTDSVAFVWGKNYVLNVNEHEIIEFGTLAGFLKSEAIHPDTDRVVLRNVFRAKDRGFDTLVVIGDYQGPCCVVGDLKWQPQRANQKMPAQRKPLTIPIDGRKRLNSQMNFR
jgi:hypothetical protein